MQDCSNCGTIMKSCIRNLCGCCFGREIESVGHFEKIMGTFCCFGRERESVGHFEKNNGLVFFLLLLFWARKRECRAFRKNNGLTVDRNVLHSLFPAQNVSPLFFRNILHSLFPAQKQQQHKFVIHVFQKYES